MTQAIHVAEKAHSQLELALPGEKGSASGNQRAERDLEAFLDELSAMTPEERMRASRSTMSGREYWAYVARFPEEAPVVNGELERIALYAE